MKKTLVTLVLAGFLALTGCSKNIVKSPGIYQTKDGNISVVHDENNAPSVKMDYIKKSERIVVFKATGKDSDGKIVRYEWNLNGNGKVDATGSTVTHIYEHPGEYNANVVAYDNHGATAFDSKKINVR